MNNINILGRLTRDPESKTAGTHSYCQFDIAVRLPGKNDRTGFYTCKAWNKTGEIVYKHFKKGQRIGIDGFLDFSEWEKDGQKRNKVYITVNQVTFIELKKDSGQSNGPASDDNIPF